MQIKIARFSALLIVSVNLLALYISWRLITNLSQGSVPITYTIQQHVTRPPNKHISKLVTLAIRDFDKYENDVTATVEHFLTVFPNLQILILYDQFPYPPLDLYFSNSTSRNVKFVGLSLSLKTSYRDHYPLFNVKTKYVLFVPDSTRIPSRQMVQAMVSDLVKQPNQLVAVPFASAKNLNCLKVDLSIRDWVLKYEAVQNVTCDAVSGKHAILVETQLLRRVTDAFMLPFPQSLYVQTAIHKIAVHLRRDLSFQDGKPLFRSHHIQLRRQQSIQNQQKEMYKKFGIKKVVRETGNTEWYGCTKETERCFKSVIDSMPSYLYEGKWTPPCCLSNLRTVARHVFEQLEESGLRYWLEGGSLLGAMRNGDILPWDHDVDIGVNRDDISMCPWLAKARNKPIVDNKGFVWEKATEGDFYRVLYSKTNRIHVNLFPFYSKNGTMTKDSWFTSHKNMEFPDHFLHPMSTIDFIGKQVPSPNNIRDFLELKFGKGAIENPQYPDPKKLKFQ